MALDLRKADGKAIIYDLVREADVDANNFRAGVMERPGFGYDELAKINSRIICAFGSGFGQRGPPPTRADRMFWRRRSPA